MYQYNDIFKYYGKSLHITTITTPVEKNSAMWHMDISQRCCSKILETVTIIILSIVFVRFFGLSTFAKWQRQDVQIVRRNEPRTLFQLPQWQSVWWKMTVGGRHKMFVDWIFVKVNEIYEYIMMTILIWGYSSFMWAPKLMNKQCCFSISIPSCFQRIKSRKNLNLSLSLILFGI